MTIRRVRSASGTCICSAMTPGLAWSQTGQPHGSGHGPHMMDWDGSWTGMMFGPIFMILVLAGVIALGILLVRWLGGGGHRTSASHADRAERHALDILKERYARGEIDSQEFEERRRAIGE